MKNQQEITQLAKQGDAEAQYALALSYELGLGVNQDLMQAFTWYQKSADQDYAKAQYNLGIFYALGKGVEKDIIQSKYWVRRANDNGYSSSSIF